MSIVIENRRKLGTDFKCFDNYPFSETILEDFLYMMNDGACIYVSGKSYRDNAIII